MTSGRLRSCHLTARPSPRARTILSPRSALDGRRRAPSPHSSTCPKLAAVRHSLCVQAAPRSAALILPRLLICWPFNLRCASATGAKRDTENKRVAQHLGDRQTDRARGRERCESINYWQLLAGVEVERRNSSTAAATRRRPCFEVLDSGACLVGTPIGDSNFETTSRLQKCRLNAVAPIHGQNLAAGRRTLHKFTFVAVRRHRIGFYGASSFSAIDAPSRGRRNRRHSSVLHNCQQCFVMFFAMFCPGILGPARDKLPLHLVSQFKHSLSSAHNAIPSWQVWNRGRFTIAARLPPLGSLRRPSVDQDYSQTGTRSSPLARRLAGVRLLVRSHEIIWRQSKIKQTSQRQPLD